jgi:phospholipid:diacylglycerol acyltransferase
MSADHVDILSNVEVLADVLRIAAGRGHELQDQIVSNISQIAERVSPDAE